MQKNPETLIEKLKIMKCQQYKNESKKGGVYYSIRKGASSEKQNCIFGELGEINFQKENILPYHKY